MLTGVLLTAALLTAARAAAVPMAPDILRLYTPGVLELRALQVTSEAVAASSCLPPAPTGRPARAHAARLCNGPQGRGERSGGGGGKLVKW
jgi:hypothetical protein